MSRAYDLETGKQAWRFYTVPGDPLEALREQGAGDGGEDLAWHRLGSSAAAAMPGMRINYDPELNLVYFGTANGAPWNRALRSPAAATTCSSPPSSR